MEAKTLDKLQQLILDAQAVQEIDGVKYTAGNLHAIYQPVPETLLIESLDGMIDFIQNNRDGVKAEDLMIHVINHRQVCLYGRFNPETNGRTGYVMASLSEQFKPFPFNRYLDHEEFIIAMLTLFEPSPDQDAFIARVQAIKSKNDEKNHDNGVTMTKTQVQGLEADGMAQKEVVKLRPFRTFSEVPQAESQFIFRMKPGQLGGISLALFECDGGAWVNGVRSNIVRYLQESLKEIPAVIPIIA